MDESTPPAAADGEPLSTLRPGEKGRVSAIDLPGSARGRILEMGITLGVTVEVIRYAPLGDPVELKVRGGHLSLRKAETAHIRVTRI